MTRRTSAATLFSAVAALFALPLYQLTAQTIDLSRLTIGVSVGCIGGTDYWDVAAQNILSTFELDRPDVFSLHRESSPGATFSIHATSYRTAHVGFTGEFVYLGLGAADHCTLVQDDGDALLAAACQAITGRATRRGAMALQGGIVVRPFSTTSIQPYVQGLVGFAFVPFSTIALTADYADQSLSVYRDYQWNESRLTGTLAAGIATSASQGYQVRFEFRETWVALPEVTGSNATQNFEPPNRSVLKVFPSILVGVDVVLKRERGRRY
jgi:hypothetical protein